MKTFSWNVRGFNSSSRQRNVKSKITSIRALFGGILETRISADNASGIMAPTFPGAVGETTTFFQIWEEFGSFGILPYLLSSTRSQLSIFYVGFLIPQPTPPLQLRLSMLRLMRLSEGSYGEI